MQKTRNRRRKRHRASITAAFDAEPMAREPRTIPIAWVTSVIAVFLLPAAWVMTSTFFTCFAREALEHEFWATEEFWFFALGSALMTIAFFGFPKPIRVYVFGHELTHAIWVWLMGGRVSHFECTSEGGHIITDRTNIWIALSPYFYPIYSMLLLVVYGGLSFFVDLAPYHQWFFALLGVTWTFHACFTLWMIPKGQTDISYYGSFFSLVIIYMMNLLVLSLMLITASSQVSFWSFGRSLFNESMTVAHWLWQMLLEPLFSRIWQTS